MCIRDRATDIPSHNINEVIDATIHVLEKPKTELKDIMKIIKGPDFSNESLIIASKDELEEMYISGRGGFKIQANWKTEKNQIIINALPYQASGSKILEQISEQMLNKKLPNRLSYTVHKPFGKHRVHNGRRFYVPLQHGPRPSAVRGPEACRCLHREFHGYFGQAVLQARFRPPSFRFQKGTVLRSGPHGWIPFRTVLRATLHRVQGRFHWDHPAKAQVWNMTF